MEQDPESPESSGENAGMHLLPELQRIVHDFARPVFRRCGRQLRIAETSNAGGHQGFACTKIGADERRHGASLEVELATLESGNQALRLSHLWLPPTRWGSALRCFG